MHYSIAGVVYNKVTLHVSVKLCRNLLMTLILGLSGKMENSRVKR